MLRESRVRPATEEEKQELSERMHRELIVPNTATILEITGRGEIAFAVFEPMPEVVPDLRRAGWRKNPVFQMSRGVAARLAMCSSHGVARRWVQRREGPGRIFLAIHYGCLLLNLDSEGALSIEPGWLNGDGEGRAAGWIDAFEGRPVLDQRHRRRRR